MKERQDESLAARLGFTRKVNTKPQGVTSNFFVDASGKKGVTPYSTQAGKRAFRLFIKRGQKWFPMATIDRDGNVIDR